MKTLARRGFLRLFAMSPLAAKAAADEAIGRAAGLFSIDGRISSGGVPAGGQTASEVDRARFIEWIKTHGFPEFERERMWADARYVHALDPDIASKKSWSMSVKILTQRQRNFERRMEEARRRWRYEDLRDALKEKLGFWAWF